MHEVGTALVVALLTLLAPGQLSARGNDILGTQKAVVGGVLRSDGTATGSLIERGHLKKTPGQAAREAQKKHGGGKVLSVKPTSGGHRVKLLSNGNVRIVVVPD